MTYTPEELRAARIAEAYLRRAQIEGRPKEVTEHLADIYETNWQPPPKVDADTLAARAWGADRWPMFAARYRDGTYDRLDIIKGFHAGLAHERAKSPNADDIAELVAAAKEAVEEWSGADYHNAMERLSRAIAKFEVTRALPDSGET